MNRAARRRAAKAQAKFGKAAKAVSALDRERVVDRYWNAVWHFDAAGLTVRDKATRRVVAVYPGV